MGLIGWLEMLAVSTALLYTWHFLKPNYKCIVLFVAHGPRDFMTNVLMIKPRLFWPFPLYMSSLCCIIMCTNDVKGSHGTFDTSADSFA